jgi:predicted metal-dependent hydrolase
MVGQFTLASYVPELTLQGLVAGVDNIHPDVFLSQKFTDIARGHLKHLIEQHGDVQQIARIQEADPFGGSPYGRAHIKHDALPPRETDSPAEFKQALSGLQLASLRRARAADDIRLDLLCRVALIKFFRTELSLQFTLVQDLCRENLKKRDDHHLERQQVLVRDRFLRFQVNKRQVLRRAAADVLSTMADVERETVASTRRSLFGDRESAGYEVLANRLIFPDSITDPYLRAEHYALFGSFDRDPDLFSRVVTVARNFLQDLSIAKNDGEADGMLCVPENAKMLMFSGLVDESARAKAQRAITSAWLTALEEAGVADYVVAAYEVVPILGDYAAVVSPQQLKCALILKNELKRVEEVLVSHDGRSMEKLHFAAQRVRSAGTNERMRYAARYLIDICRFHRDVRKMGVLENVLESINLLTNARLRELSEINGTLYEFLLPQEEKPAEQRVNDHVVLKADIRDSTFLTRSMLERGLNPASFFSLNFFEPVNKLLPKYAAEKVFIEGDAVILALLESEGQRGFAVARTCVMAREMLNIVRAYNAASTEGGLPPLEIGIGIAYQSSAPLYLMDGANRIMISEALNLSDRLSACHKRARRHFRDTQSFFNVFVFQTADEEAVAGAVEDFLLNYNVGGIHLPRAAFQKLRDEVSLEEFAMEMPMPWGVDRVRFYRGLVPVSPGVFHPILVREGRAAQVEVREFQFVRWADHIYYEVCTHPELLAMIDSQQSLTAL